MQFEKQIDCYDLVLEKRLVFVFFLRITSFVVTMRNFSFRKAFNITSYYLFFFNIFLGTFSFLFRMLKGLIIGILFLERVQKSILPRSFEATDPGT